MIQAKHTSAHRDKGRGFGKSDISCKGTSTSFREFGHSHACARSTHFIRTNDAVGTLKPFRPDAYLTRSAWPTLLTCLASSLVLPQFSWSDALTYMIAIVLLATYYGADMRCIDILNMFCMLRRSLMLLTRFMSVRT